MGIWGGHINLNWGFFARLMRVCFFGGEVRCFGTRFLGNRNTHGQNGREVNPGPYLCWANEPSVSMSTASSGYANIPNSGTSRPCSSTSLLTRMDFMAFTALKATKVKPKA